MNEERCEDYRELASAYADDRLEREDLLRLDRHLGECPGCRDFERGLHRSRELLRAAEAVSPLRRPPPGFAAAVVARIDRQPRAQVVAFPAAPAGRPASRRPWIGMVAAAAAAALLFAWSWQRLLPVESPEQSALTSPAVQAVDLAAADGGSMDTWMREHDMLARGGTLLGSAEEREIARFHPAAIPEP